jgi:phosphoadenosine phosphosulfate reductase
VNLLEKQKLAMKKSEELEKSTPESILKWAVQQFPHMTLACSFGAEDVVLVDMVYRIQPDIDIFYLDTHFHFEETYDTRDKLEERYGIKFKQVLPDLTPEEQDNRHGNKLWNLTIVSSVNNYAYD